MDPAASWLFNLKLLGLMATGPEDGAAARRLGPGRGGAKPAGLLRLSLRATRTPEPGRARGVSDSIRVTVGAGVQVNAAAAPFKLFQGP